MLDKQQRYYPEKQTELKINNTLINKKLLNFIPINEKIHTQLNRKWNIKIITKY
jgi:hypothetical protein